MQEPQPTKRNAENQMNFNNPSKSPRLPKHNQQNNAINLYAFISLRVQKHPAENIKTELISTSQLQ